MSLFEKNFKNEIKSYFLSIKLTPQQEKKIESLLRQVDCQESIWIKCRKRFLLPSLVAAALFAFVNLTGIWNAIHRYSNPNTDMLKMSAGLTLMESDPIYGSRFFLFEDMPDVMGREKLRLSLSASHGVTDFPMLSMTKLTKNNEKGVLRKIKTATGKIHGIYAWRQNAYIYGYSVVQSNAFSEGLILENPE